MEISALPNHDMSPADPFASFALNFNAMTSLHTDPGDSTWCLNVPLGPFTGGDFAMLEQGLVFPLTAADLFLFRSREDTHFNLPYVGRRASLVCHTDRSIGSGWNERLNGWGASVIV